MARIFISGSADGLGLLAGRMLAAQGHEVILHARSAERAAAARQALPAHRAVVVGDASSLPALRSLADQVNELGRCDAVIHNVAVGSEPNRVATAEGLSRTFAVNVVAPYLLTALIEPPQRLIYMSSGMHLGGEPGLEDPQWERRRWNGSQAYSDSKLHDLMIALAVARRWPGVLSNAVNPGWVPTRMGGPGAPDDLEDGARTQAWLAVGDDPGARVTGRYLHHQKPAAMHPAAADEGAQDRLLDYLQGITGAALPDPRP